MSSLTILFLFCTSTFVLSAPIALYGLNYSPRQGPDWSPTKCKSQSSILNDLTILKSITNRIRIYSLTDCNQGLIVLQVASQLDMQVMLGMWVSGNEEAFTAEMEALEVLLENDMISKEKVEAISVGSEAIYREDVTATEAVALMTRVNTLLSDKGITDVPVTITDIGDVYEANPILLSSVDFVSANAFPFWEAKAAETAVSYLVDDDLPALVDMTNAANKIFMLSETGWADAGEHPDASEASPANQVTYFEDFYCKVIVGKPTWKTFYFNGLDASWRTEQDGTENDVEGHFGIFTDAGELKSQFEELSFTCPEDGVTYSFADTPVVDPKVDSKGSKDSSTGGVLNPNMVLGMVLALTAYLL